MFVSQKGGNSEVDLPETAVKGGFYVFKKKKIILTALKPCLMSVWLMITLLSKFVFVFLFDGMAMNKL